MNENEHIHIEEAEMGLLDHLDELRGRLVKSIVAIILMMVAGWFLAAPILQLILEPLTTIGATPVVLELQEKFLTYFKVAFVLSLFLAAPVLLWQVWSFVAPGLYSHEKKWAIPFVFLGTLFFMAGGLFAFYALPFVIDFFVNFATDDLGMIDSTISLSSYVNLVLKLTLACGIIFQLPLIIWVACAAGLVTPKFLSQGRRYWIVLSLIIAAFLSPPDIYTQLILGILLVLFYELGLLGGRLLAPSIKGDEKP